MSAAANTDHTTAPMTLTWKPAEWRVERKVELVDAPNLTHKGDVYSPYTIRFDFRRVGDGPWRAYLITIYASKVNTVGAKSLIGSCLHPHLMDEVPAWLADLIAEATPKETNR